MPAPVALERTGSRSARRPCFLANRRRGRTSQQPSRAERAVPPSDPARPTKWRCSTRHTGCPPPARRPRPHRRRARRGARAGTGCAVPRRSSSCRCGTTTTTASQAGISSLASFVASNGAVSMMTTSANDRACSTRSRPAAATSPKLRSLLPLGAIEIARDPGRSDDVLQSLRRRTAGQDIGDARRRSAHRSTSGSPGAGSRSPGPGPVDRPRPWSTARFATVVVLPSPGAGDVTRMTCGIFVVLSLPRRADQAEHGDRAEDERGPKRAVGLRQRRHRLERADDVGDRPSSSRPWAPRRSPEARTQPMPRSHVVDPGVESFGEQR